AHGTAGNAVRRDDEELKHANVDYDQDRARENGITYLKTAPMSVKGAGGDDTAYRVACKLRDYGATYDTACELMRSEHWHYGCGWGPKLESKPIRNAYIYGRSAPGSAVATADDFDKMARAELEAMPLYQQAKPAFDRFVERGWNVTAEGNVLCLSR